MKPASDRALLLVGLAAIGGARFGGPGSQITAVVLIVGVLVVTLVGRILRRPSRGDSIGRSTWGELVLGAAVVALVGTIAFVLSQRANAGLEWPRAERDALRSHATWASLVRDPEPTRFGVRVELRIHGRHVLAAANGPPGWSLLRHSAGERISVIGTLRPIAEPIPAWLRARHVGARFTIRQILALRPGPRPWRLANALRSLLLRGGRVLPRRQQPLYGGFLLGDDRGQRAEITDDFRGAGLTHLLVVSGQNVAFLFVAAGPLLRRLGWRSRYGFGLALLVGFLFITRFEPSVLRAAAMAGVALTARYRGDVVSPARALALSVTILMLIDPLLAWSVGFALSVGACAGIAFLAKPIESRLPGPRWLAEPLSVTLAAQLGTGPFLIGVFGGVPVASIPANLLALPAAEPVMVWGLTGGLLAGLLVGWRGGLATRLLQWPTQVLLGWIAAVARRAAWVPLGEVKGTTAIVVCVLIVAIRAAARPKVPTKQPLKWPLRGSTGGAREPPRPAIRQRTAGRAAITLVVAVLAFSLVRPHAGDNERRLAGGGRLWRSAGSNSTWRPTVMVVSHPQLDRLLVSIRRAGVRRIDVLVVDKSIALDDLRALLARVPTSLTLAPLRAKLRTAGTSLHEVPPGTRVSTGPFLATMGDRGTVTVLRVKEG